MQPRLSVILPVYNGLAYLREAVDSILQQTYSDFKLIIVNDGSFDGSEEYLKTISDGRVTIIHQANQGQASARNHALQFCTTEFVAVMDQDDISLPNRFAVQLEFLDRHPEVVAVGTQIEFLIGTRRQKSLSAPTEHPQIQERLLQGRAGICHPSLMFRTADILACGGYPAGMMGEDIDLCLKLCERGSIANVDQVLFLYRLHEWQASQAKCKELISANNYAAYRFQCRREGTIAADFEGFLRDSSIVKRLRWTMEAWELTQYRTGRILIATGKPMQGFLRLALLATCRPIAVIRRIRQSLTVPSTNRAEEGQAAAS